MHVWHTGRGAGFVRESIMTLQHDANHLQSSRSKKSVTELQKEIEKNYNVLRSLQVCCWALLMNIRSCLWLQAIHKGSSLRHRDACDSPKEKCRMKRFLQVSEN